MPIVDADVGAGRGGSAEDLSDDQEEVVEPALLQGSFDRNSAIALAERVVLNVRMSRFRVSTGRIRFECHNSVGRGIAKPVAFQHDLERAEVEVVKNDLLCSDLQFPGLTIVIDARKLGLQRLQVLMKIGRC